MLNIVRRFFFSAGSVHAVLKAIDFYICYTNKATHIFASSGDIYQLCVKCSLIFYESKLDKLVYVSLISAKSCVDVDLSLPKNVAKYKDAGMSRDYNKNVLCYSFAVSIHLTVVPRCLLMFWWKHRAVIVADFWSLQWSYREDPVSKSPHIVYLCFVLKYITQKQHVLTLSLRLGA